MSSNDSTEKASKVAALVAGVATFIYFAFTSDHLILAFTFGWIPAVISAMFAYFLWSTKYIFIAAFAILLLLIAISKFS